MNYYWFLFYTFAAEIDTIDNEEAIIEHAASDSIHTGLRWWCDA